MPAKSMHFPRYPQGDRRVAVPDETRRTRLREDDAPNLEGSVVEVEQIVQVAGALVILVAYVASQTGHVDTSSLTYLIPNLIGAGTLAADAWARSQWGFTLLEGTWCAVSAVSLLSRSPVAARAGRAAIRRGLVRRMFLPRR
jgi:hypothetical protein